jgi:hypothetical protein
MKFTNPLPGLTTGLWLRPVLTLGAILSLSVPDASRGAPAAAGQENPPEPSPAAAPASWVQPVPGWVPVQAGEHPRLLFRKSDLPALRKRAQTPDGQAILARLKATLGGGEAMPTILNPAKTSYSSDSQSSPELRKEGAYTISHAAGFGFLYQITGDRKYADLAQKCVELAMKGQRDRDDRYSLLGYANDAHLRAAPTYGMYALAYDLCYDAWSPEFRKRFVDTLMTANKETDSDLPKIAIKPNHMPTSNHWGAQVGGVSLVLLALNGDPGVDQKFIDTALPLNEKRLEALFTNGWGDAGWFAESTGPSHVSANSAILPALQAFKNAAGKDYTQRDSVRWMTMRWAYDLFPREGRPAYACRLIGDNLTYGTEDFLGYGNGGGFTHGGWFSQGFGAIPERDKPALLWAYRNYVEKAIGDRYDIRNYPHRAILAFLNWPIGVEPKNPAEVLPKVRFDSHHGYVSFRNHWTETGDDIVVSVWTVSGPRGWIGRKGPGQPGASHGDVGIWAYGGRRVGMGKMIGEKPTILWQNPDGSGQVTCKNTTLAVDFSGKSGSDALLVGIGVGIQNGLNPRVRAVTRGLMLGDKKVYVGSINKTGIHPEPRLDSTGAKIIVGGQTVSLADGKFSFVPATAEEAAGGGTIDANKAVAAERAKIAAAEQRNEPKPEEIVLPSDPPVFAYGFESIEKEGAAQVFRDSSPNKLTLRVKGAPVSLKDGPVGKAVLLNGADNALIIDPNPAIDMADKNLTLVHWFKNETTEGGVEWVLVEKNTWQGMKAPDCYSTCVDAAGNYGFNTPNSSAFAREPIPWSDGKWHCVATVFDATNQKTYHYFDGKLISSKGIAVHGPIGPGSAPLTIGARGAEKTANHFGGLLDEVTLYSRALTRGEIRALYNLGKVNVEQATE